MDDTGSLKFDYKCFQIFLYNNERIVLVEENLAYFSSVDDKEQFNLIDSAKINDIVQLVRHKKTPLRLETKIFNFLSFKKLFKEDETRIVISLVDESKNSKQINWSFSLNKQFVLSQLISQLKEIWEKTFFIELPISY